MLKSFKFPWGRFGFEVLGWVTSGDSLRPKCHHVQSLQNQALIGAKVLAVAKSSWPGMDDTGFKGNHPTKNDGCFCSKSSTFALNQLWSFPHCWEAWSSDIYAFSSNGQRWSCLRCSKGNPIRFQADNYEFVQIAVGWAIPHGFWSWESQPMNSISFTAEARTQPIWLQAGIMSRELVNCLE